jgi:GntR family transcriptional regulator
VGRNLRYLAVADDLRDQIASGAYPRGRLLPAETELATAHQVSRATIRKALGDLKRDGLVDSRQGFGWSAVATPLRQSLERLTTIDEQIVAAGRSPRHQVLSFAFTASPPLVAKSLGTATVLEVSRLSLVDDEPFARLTTWVPDYLAADLSRRAVEQEGVCQLLDVTFGGATQVITAVGADAADAELLHVLEGTPLLSCVRTTTNENGVAVLLNHAVFNPLTTEFVVDLPVITEADPHALRLVQ